MFKDREVQQNWNQKERGGDFFFSLSLPTVGIQSFVCYNLLIPSMQYACRTKFENYFFFGKGMNELKKNLIR